MRTATPEYLKRNVTLVAIGIALVVAGGIAWHSRDGRPVELEPVVVQAPRANGNVPAGATTTRAAPTFAHPQSNSVLGGPVIKSAPTTVLDFDERGGRILVDAAAIEALVPGQYMYLRYGEHIVAHRVHDKERRSDHTYVALTGVDPVAGKFNLTYGAYYLYDDGTVMVSVNHDAVAFTTEGRAGQPIAFRNLRGTKAEQEAYIKRVRAEEAQAAAEGRPVQVH